MNYFVGYYSDKGNRKEINQDSLLIKVVNSSFGRIGLFIVCDGMGGLNYGEIASASVINEFSNWFDTELKDLDITSINENIIYEKISTRILNVNDRIIKYSKKVGAKLGTTLTLLLVIKDTYFICQIGDSRVYEINNDVQILTKDQTLVAREVERGVITEEEAKVDKRRNILLQCIGVKDDIKPVFSSGKIKNNTVYIICTDGFYRKIENRDLKAELSPNLHKSNYSLDKKARELTNLVMNRGESDNISTIIIKTV